MVRAKKIDEQKVDLLQKFISPKMGELVLRLAREINNNDYIGWSKQIDMFAKNLVNYIYRANLKNAGYRLSTQAPTPILTLILTLVVTREPIDLNRILDTERKRRFDNRLYLTYSLPSY